MLELVNSFWRSLLAIVFPNHCPVCGADSGVERKWCHSCVPKNLIMNIKTHITSEQVILPLVMLFSYRGIIKELLHRGKFNKNRSALLWLSALCQQIADANGISSSVSDLLRGEQVVAVPVPLSKKRIRERGFNQIELIFRQWLTSIGVEWYPALKRAKETLPQYKLIDYGQRRKNVQGCFVVAEEACVRGKTLLLVDDVITSGATMYECIAVLDAGGAKKISGLALCTARPQDYSN